MGIELGTCDIVKTSVTNSMHVGTRRLPSARLLGISIAVMLAGVVMMVAPHVGTIDISVFVAWLLIFTSAFHLAFAWPFRQAPAVLWPVLLSVGYAAIGLYLLGHPELTVDTIRKPLGAWLMIDGLLEWGVLSRIKTARGWLLLDAIATIVIAAVVASGRPSLEPWGLAALIGINTFLGGLTRFFVGLSSRRTM